MTTPEDTQLLWHAIEAQDSYELQHVFTNKSAGVVQLSESAKHNRLEVVRHLVERGADVNAVRADGFTPLLLAVFFGHLDVVKLLVEHGADLTACTRFGTSAEMWAQARGFTEIVEYLHHCQDQSLQLVDSSSENDEWRKESLIAEPVIEEPLVTEPVIEESLVAERVIEEAHIAEPVIEELVIADPIIEEPPIIETFAAPRDEYLEPPIPTASLDSTEDDDDEVTLVRPRPAKALKDPPEIWDLVHENRNSFNPRAAFLSHVGSTRARIALLTVLVVAIGAVIGFATMGLPDGTSASAVESIRPRKPDPVIQPEKAKQQSPPVSSADTQPKAAEEKPNVPVNKDNESQPSTIASAPTISDIPQVRSSKQSRRTIASASTPSSASETPKNIPAENVPSKSETQTVAPVRTVTVTATVDAQASAKKTPDSDSKLIQKSSATQPRKPRVIQWP